VEMDVLGIAYHHFTHEQRDHVCVHHPRETNFKENVIEHFEGHYQEAIDDVREREGRCPCAEAYELCPPELLLDHSWLSLAELTSPAASQCGQDGHQPREGKSRLDYERHSMGRLGRL